MATIAYCHFKSAVGLAKTVYDDIVRTYGIREPHGIYQLMGHTPAFLAASWQRSRHLYGTAPDDTNVSLSRLSLMDKHYVTLAISATNNCEYCVRLHTTRLEQLGATAPDLIELMMVLDVVTGRSKFTEGVRIGDRPTMPPASGPVDESPAGDLEALNAYQRHVPDYMQASWERTKLAFLEKGRLGLRTKHMVAYGVAATNGNDFHVGLHARRLLALGMTQQDLVELILVIDLACGYNRYVQGLQIVPGERPFVPTADRSRAADAPSVRAV